MKMLSALATVLFVALPLRGTMAAPLPSCALAPTSAAEATLMATELLPALTAVLAETGGCKLQDPTHTAAELASAREMGLDCASLDDTECLRKLAALLRVKRIIGAAAREEGDSIALTLVLVGVKADWQLAAVDGLVPKTGRERRAALQELAAGLLDPDRDRGSLRLIVTQAGALVMLDGKPVGNTPLEAPVSGLEQGSHELMVQLDGYKTLAQMVQVVAGEEQEFALALERLPAETEGSPTPEAVEQPSDSVIVAEDSDAAAAEPVSTEVVGWTLAGIGGGVAAVGALGAVALDSTLLYSGAGDYDSRSGMLVAEKALAGVAAVGLVAGALGLGMALWEAGQ